MGTLDKKISIRKSMLPAKGLSIKHLYVKIKKDNFITPSTVEYSLRNSVTLKAL